MALYIDEFKGSSGKYDSDIRRWIVNEYHCNIADGDKGCVIDVFPLIDQPLLQELSPLSFDAIEAVDLDGAHDAYTYDEFQRVYNNALESMRSYREACVMYKAEAIEYRQISEDQH